MRPETASWPPPRTQASGRPGVKAALTVHVMRPVVENDEFVRFARRVGTAHSRRVAGGDVEALRDLDAFGQAREAAMAAAIRGLRGAGYSWTDIGDQLAVTRQGAHQRWGGEL